MKIALIDYDAGNIFSVLNALNFIKSNSHQIFITKNKEEIIKADKIILPGVGAFGDCINALSKNSEFLFNLKNQITQEKKLFLGICVGMQVLASIGFEDGKHQGLDLIAGSVKKISSTKLAIPHMGWNEVIIKKNHPLFLGIENKEHFYFANSYHFETTKNDDILAEFEYGEKMTAAINHKNIMAVQFHPEKSGEKGLKILQNFLAI
jgi:glutamine amidotransferase